MNDQPSGTLTFFFTDIEGSTRLWEQHPESMRVALTKHDDILRQVIIEHGGRVFKTVGDKGLTDLKPCLKTTLLLTMGRIG